MTAGQACPLIFRPAYPDEEGRASFVEGNAAWRLPGSFVFLALDSQERIVAVIRCSRSGGASERAAFIDFRIAAGPGGEIAGWESDFISAFVAFARQNFRGTLRYLPMIDADHPLNGILARAGFSIRYREYHLEAPVQGLAARVARSHRALQQFPSPLESGITTPVRECDPRAVIRLLTKLDLMNEAEIHSIWETEDRRLLDRDASCCFMLDGELLGVVLAADAGENLKIMAIAVREEVPGAKLWVTPHLMHYLFQTTAYREYRQAFFRANAETAPTTFNFATRAGGKVVADLHRWVREIG